MFFAEDRIEHMRAMILADNEKDRRAALKKLLPMQRADFVGLFKAMESLPVTIRTIDPPLHEFLPKREDLLVEIQHLEDTKPRSPKLKELRTLLARVEELHEQNPMLGLRGCRLGIAFPEITEMQARAIIEAAVAVKVKGGDPHPEIMIPLVGSIEEMRNQAAIVRRVAGRGLQGEGRQGRLHGGHHDRAAARGPHRRSDRRRGRVLQLRHQRPDADHLRHLARRHQQLPACVSQGSASSSRIPSPPSTRRRGPTGEDGRGQGTQHPANLKVGICGEHGGDPESVKFCHRIGLNYVSCSPFRLLTARLAAAQAARREDGN
jgi:pyruvate,orthophosphate dikinase